MLNIYDDMYLLQIKVQADLLSGVEPFTNRCKTPKITFQGFQLYALMIAHEINTDHFCLNTISILPGNTEVLWS
jgi:hypothetical protein